MKPKITPFLWFNNNAEEAMNYYATIFPNTKILDVSHYGDAGPGPKGSVMTATFELLGQQLIALNGGPQFQFTEAISLVVDCDTQGEIDHYWESLSRGGEKSRCGWLKDKFGLWWQIVPPILAEYVADKDMKKSQRVMQAMLKMDKIEIQKLTDAFNGK